MVKIGAGSLRGRSLEVADGVRPTSGRSKEALFSRWHESLQGCLFLDLFAGSGGIGLEAISRGAREAVLVERRGKPLRTLRANCERLASRRSVITPGELPRMPPAVVAHAPYDLVFADPPYDFDAYSRLLERIATLLDRSGEAAIEHSSRLDLEASVAGLVSAGSRKYGESRLSFYVLEAA